MSGPWRSRYHDWRARRRGLRGDVVGALRHTRAAVEHDPDGTDDASALGQPIDGVPAWSDALSLPGQPDLAASLRQEACRYFELTPEQIQAAFDAPLPDAWGKSAYAESDVRELFAADRAFLFANLRVAGTDPHVPARVAIARLFRDHGAKRVLDYGAGVGNMALYFAAAGLPEVALADLSEPILELARWRFEQHGRAKPETYVLGRDELPDASFDGVAIFDVFEVVPDPLPILEACHRALAPGGLLALAVGLPAPLAGRAWLIGQPAEVAIAAAHERFGPPLDLGRIRRRAFYVFQRGENP